MPILYAWFKEPHVKEWWPVPEEQEDFFKEFLVKIRSKDNFPFLVFMNGKPLGYIQYYYIDRSSEKSGAWLPELPKETIGIDQFIGDPDYLSKGYGTLFIKEFIMYLRSTLEPWVTAIIVDPEPDNSVAVHCYEKVGFRHVGIYKPSYGDALLMRYDIS